jgi:DNA-directed RNA polymerase subunit RPC12/RpoP
LISEKHVCPVLGDLQLASLCVDYLNFPGFTDELEDMDRLILEGYYAFMDYAVTYWVRHLEACLVFLGKEDSGVVDISGALENFIELHYTAPATRLPITKRNAARLRCLEGLDCYDELQRAVRSTRKQLSFYGELDEDEVALDLGNIVKGVREALEKLVLKAQSGDGTCEKLEKYYGSNLFKCPRLSCKFFSNGFATATQRDQHLGKHQRPFRCTVSGCPNGTIGMSSERELQKHTKEAHGEVQYGDEFPDEDEEIAQSPFQALPTRLESPAASSLGNAQENHDSESDVVVQSMGLGRRRLRLSNKRRRQYKCQHCGKIFHRKFNLDSHLHTHSTERSWNCGICSKAFAREGDYKRHIKGHSDAKSFKCGGCGRGFARRDTLATHYKSRMGRSCLEIQASQS